MALSCPALQEETRLGACPSICIHQRYSLEKQRLECLVKVLAPSHLSVGDTGSSYWMDVEKPIDFGKELGRSSHSLGLFHCRISLLNFTCFRAQ